MTLDGLREVVVIVSSSLGKTMLCGEIRRSETGGGGGY